MLQNSLACLNWSEVVEKSSPGQVKSADHAPILYVSDIQKAKMLYENFFEDFPKFKLPSGETNLKFLRMHYRGCDFTLNEAGQFEFDGRFPTFTSISSPFIFYIYAENPTSIFNKALSGGFKVLPAFENLEKFELLIFLVICGKESREISLS